MGSGKSTVGRRVAARVDRPFVDLDEAIETAAGRTIADLFATGGEAAFRDLEAGELRRLLDGDEPLVVAGGGGVVVRDENRARLRDDDVTVVWLDAAPAFLASRIEKKAHRPLLEGDETPRQVLERMLEARAPLYQEVADITVDVAPFHRTEEKPKDALADRIVRLVEKHERARAKRAKAKGRR
jgi:shikimate kinase